MSRLGVQQVFNTLRKLGEFKIKEIVAGLEMYEQFMEVIST